MEKNNWKEKNVVNCMKIFMQYGLSEAKEKNASWTFEIFS